MSFAQQTLRKRLRLFWGTPRRLFFNVFRPGTVRENLVRRLGACHRCGACCQMGTRCRYLRSVDGFAACSIYNKYRFPNCRNFPMDKTDLAERDLVSPDVPCGFRWPPQQKNKSSRVN